MRERVESLGGRFSVTSEIGHGTQVSAWLPLRAEEGENER
jgi:signal transduction histidine kinase